MNFVKRALVNQLLSMAERGASWDPSDADVDRLRSVILMATSHSPDACRDVDLLSYDIYPTFHDESVRARGLVAGTSNTPLTDITAGLAGMDEVPARLRRSLPEVDPESFRASMLVLHAIATALEWTEYDARYSEPDANEIEREIAASLRSLEAFRRSGEP